MSLFKCVRVCASESVYMCFCAHGTMDICALTCIGLLVREEKELGSQGEGNLGFEILWRKKKKKEF